MAEFVPLTPMALLFYFLVLKQLSPLILLYGIKYPNHHYVSWDKESLIENANTSICQGQKRDLIAVMVFIIFNAVKFYSQPTYKNTLY